MHISIILAHPNKKSFNHAIANAASGQLRKNGHDITVHDICLEKFDSNLSYEEFSGGSIMPKNIADYCREISQADGIIIIHPNWWGQPPAILKGWIDRVLRPGIAYRFEEGDKGEGVPIGLLKAKAAIVFNTSNTQTERELNVFHDPLETIWKNCIFGLCGVNTFYRKTYCVVITSTLQQREEWLQDVSKIVNRYFPQN